MYNKTNKQVRRDIRRAYRSYSKKLEMEHPQQFKRHQETWQKYKSYTPGY